MAGADHIRMARPPDVGRPRKARSDIDPPAAAKAAPHLEQQWIGGLGRKRRGAERGRNSVSRRDAPEDGDGASEQDKLSDAHLRQAAIRTGSVS